MKQIILPIIMIAIAISAFLAYTTAKQAIRLDAIDGCLKAGTATATNAEGVVIQTPDEYSYNLCMERKGLK